MGNAIKIIGTYGGTQAQFTGASLGPLSTGGVAKTNPGNIVASLYTGTLQQIMGLVPLLPCGYQDCRDTQSEACFLLPVFGVPPTTTKYLGSTYQNDCNTFTVNASNSAQFIIEKEQNGWFAPRGPLKWSTVETITNNNFGLYYPAVTTGLGNVYSVFTVNWGLVLAAHGPGIYRISANSCINTYSPAQLSIIDSGIPTRATGTITIGAWSTNVGYAGTITQDVNYLAGIINGSPTTTATTTGSQLNLTGPKGTIVIFKGINNLTGQPFTLTWKLAGGGVLISTVCSCQGQSIPFLLRAWNCDQAHGTTKFECWNTGTIGDEENDGVLFDLCNITIYDSIRVKGFFGNKSFEYDAETYQWGVNNSVPFGTTQDSRDKATKLYKWFSNYLPMWAHNGIATYFMMADTKCVSDYNHNNSDYNLMQRKVVKKSGYKPEYLDEKTFDAGLRYHNRTSKVEMEMAVGIQSIIKSIACQTQ